MDQVDILLDKGDIMVSPTGDFDFAKNNVCIAQAAINNLGIRLHELPLQYPRGNGIYTKRVKMSTDGISIVDSECRSAILYDSRISSIDSLTVTQLESYDYKIDFSLVKRDGSGIVESSAIIEIGVM